MSSTSNKTVPTSVSVDDFLATLSEQRQAESRQIIAIMREITGHEPVMWGPSIVGFGSYHYKYKSGREGDAPAAAFAPRKANLVIYLDDPISRYEGWLEKLGPHTTSKVCLYVKKLSAVDLNVLRELLAASYRDGSTHESTPRAE